MIYSAYKLNKQADNIQPIYPFPSLEPVHCSMSSSNCCFLTCIQVSQEAGKVVWYFHPFKNFPQFVVIHTVKGFSIVNEAVVFLDFPSFLYDPTNVGNLISDSSAFSKPSLYIWKFSVHILLKPSLKDFECNLTSMQNECSCLCLHAKLFQLCLTLCNPMDCSPPGSSVLGMVSSFTKLIKIKSESESEVA